MLDFPWRPQVRSEPPQFRRSPQLEADLSRNKTGMCFRFRVIELATARPVKDLDGGPPVANRAGLLAAADRCPLGQGSGLDAKPESYGKYCNCTGPSASAGSAAGLGSCPAHRIRLGINKIALGFGLPLTDFWVGERATNKATMSFGINRCANYVPIAKVKDLG